MAPTGQQSPDDASRSHRHRFAQTAHNGFSGHTSDRRGACEKCRYALTEAPIATHPPARPLQCPEQPDLALGSRRTVSCRSIAWPLAIPQIKARTYGTAPTLPASPIESDPNRDEIVTITIPHNRKAWPAARDELLGGRRRPMRRIWRTRPKQDAGRTSLINNRAT